MTHSEHLVAFTHLLLGSYMQAVVLQGKAVARFIAVLLKMLRHSTINHDVKKNWHYQAHNLNPEKTLRIC